eukprot:g7492.t1
MSTERSKQDTFQKGKDGKYQIRIESYDPARNTMKAIWLVSRNEKLLSELLDKCDVSEPGASDEDLRGNLLSVQRELQELREAMDRTGGTQTPVVDASFLTTSGSRSELEDFSEASRPFWSSLGSFESDKATKTPPRPASAAPSLDFGLAKRKRAFLSQIPLYSRPSIRTDFCVCPIDPFPEIRMRASKIPRAPLKRNKKTKRNKTTTTTPAKKRTNKSTPMTRPKTSLGSISTRTSLGSLRQKTSVSTTSPKTSVGVVRPKTSLGNSRPKTTTSKKTNSRTSSTASAKLSPVRRPATSMALSRSLGVEKLSQGRSTEGSRSQIRGSKTMVLDACPSESRTRTPTRSVHKMTRSASSLGGGIPRSSSRLSAMGTTRSSNLSGRHSALGGSSYMDIYLANERHNKASFADTESHVTRANSVMRNSSTKATDKVSNMKTHQRPRSSMEKKSEFQSTPQVLPFESPPPMLKLDPSLTPSLKLESGSHESSFDRSVSPLIRSVSIIDDLPEGVEGRESNKSQPRLHLGDVEDTEYQVKAYFIDENTKGNDILKTQGSAIIPSSPVEVDDDSFQEDVEEQRGRDNYTHYRELVGPEQKEKTMLMDTAKQEIDFSADNVETFSLAFSTSLDSRVEKLAEGKYANREEFILKQNNNSSLGETETVSFIKDSMLNSGSKDQEVGNKSELDSMDFGFLDEFQDDISGLLDSLMTQDFHSSTTPSLPPSLKEPEEESTALKNEAFNSQIENSVTAAENQLLIESNANSVFTTSPIEAPTASEMDSRNQTQKNLETIAVMMEDIHDNTLVNKTDEEEKEEKEAVTFQDDSIAVPKEQPESAINTNQRSLAQENVSIKEQEISGTLSNDSAQNDSVTQKESDRKTAVEKTVKTTHRQRKSTGSRAYQSRRSGRGKTQRSAMPRTHSLSGLESVSEDSSSTCQESTTITTTKAGMDFEVEEFWMDNHKTEEFEVTGSSSDEDADDGGSSVETSLIFSSSDLTMPDGCETYDDNTVSNFAECISQITSDLNSVHDTIEEIKMALASVDTSSNENQTQSPTQLSLDYLTKLQEASDASKPFRSTSLQSSLNLSWLNRDDGILASSEEKDDFDESDSSTMEQQQNLLSSDEEEYLANNIILDQERLSPEYQLYIPAAQSLDAFDLNDILSDVTLPPTNNEVMVSVHNRGNRKRKTSSRCGFLRFFTCSKTLEQTDDPSR